MHLPNFSHLTVIALALAAIAGIPQPTTAQEASAKILELTGKVQLKRSGWSNYQTVGVGTALRRGDLLFPAAGARVTVQCNSLRLWRVPAGVPSGLSNGCPQGQVVARGLRGGDNTLITVSGGVNATIPYIMTPRRSWILSQTPTLRWNSVAGASQYTVRVKGPDVDWSTQVESNSVVYPGTPALQPGATYLVTVQANTRKSSQGDRQSNTASGIFYADGQLAGYGFSLLPPDKAAFVRAGREKIEAQQLSKEAKAIALADLYSQNELYANAIAQLESLVQDGDRPISVHQTLGQLYSHVGLGALAKEQFLKALGLATAVQNVEGQALAHEGLSALYEANGNLKTASQYLKQAKLAYEQLGDTKRVNELQSKLAKLTNQPG